MSTVAYRDGVMAADTLASGPVCRTTKKLHRVGDVIIGGVGNLSDLLVFVRWYGSGADLKALPEFRMYGRNDEAPDFSALVLSPRGLTHWTEYFQPLPVFDDYTAVGSGAYAALGAMAVGAAAAEAIAVAAQIDVHTGGEIHTMQLGVAEAA